jgi:hypothetical protein
MAGQAWQDSWVSIGLLQLLLLKFTFFVKSLQIEYYLYQSAYRLLCSNKVTRFEHNNRRCKHKILKTRHQIAVGK